MHFIPECIFEHAQKTDAPESATIAEVMFSHFVAEHNLPAAIADPGCSLAPRMFPDSTIAKAMKCRRETTMILILFVTFQSLGFLLVTRFRILRVFFFRPKCLTLRGHVTTITILFIMAESSKNFQAVNNDTVALPHREGYCPYYRPKAVPDQGSNFVKKSICPTDKWICKTTCP